MLFRSRRTGARLVHRCYANRGRARSLSDYEAILRRTAELRPAVDLFFDKVLVMAEDERIRRNRLALLHWLLSAFTRVADFSEIITSKEKQQTR